MTARERLLAALNRLPLDRLPVDLGHTGEVGLALRRNLGAADGLSVYRTLDIDKFVRVFSEYRRHATREAFVRNTWDSPLEKMKAGAARSKSSKPELRSNRTSLWWTPPRPLDFSTPTHPTINPLQ